MPQSLNWYYEGVKALLTEKNQWIAIAKPPPYERTFSKSTGNIMQDSQLNIDYEIDIDQRYYPATDDE